MRYRFLVLSLFMVCTIGKVSGQSTRQKEALHYVLVPSESMLLVIASQPSAPVRFEDTKLLMSIDRQELAISYKVRNIGTKPIRYLTPVMWTSLGTGGTLTGSGPSSGRASNELVMPGETIKEGQSDEPVSLTAELRERLGLRGKMRAIVVVMVGHVTFSDGTTYDDDGLSKALIAYFEDLSTKLERLAVLDRQR